MGYTIKQGLIGALIGLAAYYPANASNTGEIDSNELIAQSYSEHSRLRDLYFSGHQDKAIDEALQYLTKDPGNGNVRLVLAQFYMDRKQYDQARLQLNYILKETPKYTEARIALINLEINQKNNERANFLLRKGLALSPENQQLKNISLPLDAPIAVKEEKKKQPLVVSPKPEDVQPLVVSSKPEYVKLRELYNAGEKKLAIARAEKYIVKHPNDSDVRLVLAQFYMAEKRYFLARQQLNLVIKQTPAYVEARISLIKIDLAEKKYSHAEMLVNHGLTINPFNISLKSIKADIIYAQRPAIRARISEQEVTEYQKLFAAGEYNKVIRQAKIYLQQYPDDGDVRLILGQVYMQKKQYVKAIYQFRTALAKTPRYTAVRVALINVLLQLRGYIDAQIVLDEGLRLQPKSVDLQSEQANIYFERGKFYRAAKTIKPIIAKHPENLVARSVVSKLNSMSPRYMIGPNTIGAYSENLNVSDINQNWNYSTAFYGRDTDMGYVTAKVNYARRFGIDAPQFELEAYPVLSKYVYFDIVAAQSNEPVLFPKFLVGAEGYFSLPDFIDVSIGGKYNYITRINKFSYYTGSVGKQVGNHLLSFRPYYFIPNAGSNTLLYTGRYRYNIKGDVDNYIEIGGGTGKSPDLNNLLATNFIVIENDYAYINYSLPLFSHKIVVNIGGSYNNQYYPIPGFKRILRGGTVAILRRF